MGRRLGTSRGILATDSLNGVYAQAFELAFSPDGASLLTGVPTQAEVWGVETQQLHYVLRPSRTGIRGVAFGPDGRTLATVHSGYPKGGVLLWKLP